MAIVEVKVPQLSESVAEATLLQWKKKPGETVAIDEILVEVETDKVVLEVPLDFYAQGMTFSPDGKTAWEAIPGKPRDMSQEPLACEMTRAEVKKDCVQFLKTHRFDEGMGTYVPIKK